MWKNSVLRICWIFLLLLALELLSQFMVGYTKTEVALPVYLKAGCLAAVFLFAVLVFVLLQRQGRIGTKLFRALKGNSILCVILILADWGMRAFTRVCYPLSAYFPFDILGRCIGILIVMHSIAGGRMRDIRLCPEHLCLLPILVFVAVERTVILGGMTGAFCGMVDSFFNPFHLPDVFSAPVFSLEKYVMVFYWPLAETALFLAAEKRNFRIYG